MITLLAPMTALLISGIPVAFAIAIGCFLFVWITDQASSALLVQRMVEGIDSFTLLTVPLFILAGELMVRGGVMRRLLAFPDAVLGHVRGGIGVVNVAGSVMFGGISGSGVADVAALGTVMGPEMIRRGFKPGFAAALQGVAGVLAIVIPPSITLILIGVSGGISIAGLFLAGIVPGVMAGVLLMLYTHVHARRANLPHGSRASLGTVARSLLVSTPPIAVFFIILVGILAGIFTATESSAAAALYALFLGGLVYRELTFADIRDALHATAISTGAVMIIIAATSAFSWLLVANRATEHLLEFFLTFGDSKIVVFTMIMVFLIILGAVLETVPVVLVATPLLLPVATQAGFDPIHFATMMCLNLAVGGNTPPVAINLMAACQILRTRMEDTFPHILYMLAILTLVIIVVAFVPQLALFLPQKFGYA